MVSLAWRHHETPRALAVYFQLFCLVVTWWRFLHYYSEQPDPLSSLQGMSRPVPRTSLPRFFSSFTSLPDNRACKNMQHQGRNYLCLCQYFSTQLSHVPLGDNTVLCRCFTEEMVLRLAVRVILQLEGKKTRQDRGSHRAWGYWWLTPDRIF